MFIRIIIHISFYNKVRKSALQIFSYLSGKVETCTKNKTPIPFLKLIVFNKRAFAHADKEEALAEEN